MLLYNPNEYLCGMLKLPLLVRNKVIDDDIGEEIGGDQIDGGIDGEIDGETGGEIGCGYIVEEIEIDDQIGEDMMGGQTEVESTHRKLPHIVVDYA